MPDAATTETTATTTTATETTAGPSAHPGAPGRTRSPAGMRRALEGLIGVPATEGNQIEVLRNGDRIFPAMLEAIGEASETVDLLTFVYWSGSIGEQFAEALATSARKGVRVRVLLDALGARPMTKDLLELMTEAGCDLRWFRPVTGGEIGGVNHRTHRKVLICDERVSFTGGVGIADEWLGDARDETEWRDTHFRIEGPATDGLRAAFVDNWAEAGGDLFDPAVDRFPDQPQPGTSAVQVVRAAAEAGWSDIATLFRALTRLAEERIRITTAYFNPDDLLLELLCDARARGVEVEILVPGEHIDKRFVQLAGETSFGPLLEAGARVHCFAPSMLHAKVMTVDGLVANVGSANLNHRSSLYDEEVNLVVFDLALVAELDAHFEEDLTRSVALDTSWWEERGLLQKARERVAGTIGKLI